MDSEGTEANKGRILDAVFTAQERGKLSPDDFSRLVGYFKELFQAEALLPQETYLCNLHTVAHCRKVDTVEILVREVRGAINDSLTQGLSPEDMTVRYSNTFSYLEGFVGRDDDPTIMEREAKLFRISPRVCYSVPSSMCEDEETFGEVLDAITKLNLEDIDKPSLSKVLLPIARRRNDLNAVIELIDLKSEDGRQFALEHFDWTCNSENPGWLTGLLLNVDEIRNDPSKRGVIMDKLIKLDSYDTDNLINSSDENFIQWLVDWALEHIGEIRNIYFIKCMVSVSKNNEDNAKRFIDELEKRGEWRNIARIRILHDVGKPLRHYAESILDKNVDNIPILYDREKHPADGLDEEDGVTRELIDRSQSVFATIGMLGLDTNARLRVIERMKELYIQLKAQQDVLKYNPWKILQNIATRQVYGENAEKYSNDIVTRAARKVLEELD